MNTVNAALKSVARKNKIPVKSLRKYLVASHEAAHVLLFLLHRIPFRYATLRKDKDSNGHVERSSIGVVKLMTSESSQFVEMQILLAGGVGEMMVMRALLQEGYDHAQCGGFTEEGMASDFDQHSITFRELFGDEMSSERIRELTVYQLDYLRDVLERWQESHRRIAELLFRSKTMVKYGKLQKLHREACSDEGMRPYLPAYLKPTKKGGKK